MIKKLLAFTFIGLFTLAPAQATEDYDAWKVWAPPVASVYLGFGSGQGLQDRFKDTGWMYAVADGIGIGLIFLSYGDCAEPAGSCQSNKQRNIDAGKGILIVSRVLQIADSSIWSYNYYQKFKSPVVLIPSADGATLLTSISF
jgi:hypothetical protein